MPITKYASYEVSEILDVKGSPKQSKVATLDKLSDFHDFRTEDGYLYVRIRAISSRVNKNHDGWPSVELAGGQDIWDKVAAQRESGVGGITVEADTKSNYGYSTFVGKPIFVDHHNSDPGRARGVIVDAKLHIEDHKTASDLDPYYANAPADHTPPTWVELLLEVDAKSFPVVAKAILEGSQDSDKGIDGFSMGCDVDKTVCSICSNVATSPDAYCNHVKLKGASFDVYDDMGRKTSKRAYEDCYGIKFFEISAVFDPADETALTREVIAAIHKEADAGTVPQDELTTAPEEVNTLREEHICPICGSTIDDTKCDVCGYVPPPEGLDNPDLSKAQERRERVEDEPSLTDTPAAGVAQQGGESYLRARNSNQTVKVISDMAWEPHITPRLAAVLADNGVQSDEPQTEEVLKDEDRPTTARTASGVIADAAKEKTTVSDKKVAADPADPSATADKQVDVTGVGGVQDASNEQASKADAQVDVQGQGSTGVADVSADETQSIDETADDNAGFDTKKNTDDSGPTSTFPKGKKDLDVGSVHDNEPFPKGGAKSGGDPTDPVGKPDERVDLEQEVPVSWNQSENGTDQWTGTDGNGVTKQQPPVTREVDPNIDVRSSAVLFAAFKLADEEVELGLISKDRKYDRVSELERKSPETIRELQEYAAKVRTAGLNKPQVREAARRVPSLASKSAAVTTESSEETDDIMNDSALFG